MVRGSEMGMKRGGTTRTWRDKAVGDEAGSEKRGKVTTVNGVLCVGMAAYGTFYFGRAILQMHRKGQVHTLATWPSHPLSTPYTCTSTTSYSYHILLWHATLWRATLVASYLCASYL